MRSCWAISGFSSILTLTRRTAPLASVDRFFQHRAQLFAGAAPGRPEIHDHRDFAACLQHVGGEGCQPGILDMGTGRARFRALCAGVEVTGRPPGPIKAMMRSFVVETRKMGAQGLKVKPLRFFDDPHLLCHSRQRPSRHLPPLSLRPRGKMSGTKTPHALGNQLAYPVRQREGGGVDFRIVIVASSAWCACKPPWLCGCRPACPAACRPCWPRTAP